MLCPDESRTLGDIEGFAEIARVFPESDTATAPVVIGSARAICSRAVIACGNVGAARGGAASTVTFGVKLRFLTGSDVTRATFRGGSRTGLGTGFERRLA